jgi:hypothetical protein
MKRTVAIVAAAFAVMLSAGAVASAAGQASAAGPGMHIVEVQTAAPQADGPGMHIYE